MTRTFFTSKTARWRAPSCHNYSVNINTILWPFAIFTYSSQAVHLQTQYCASHFQFTQKFKVLKQFFEKKIFSGNYHVYKNKLFLNWQHLMWQTCCSHVQQLIANIIISHKLGLTDLFCPRLIVFSEFFKVIFIHTVYNSALFWHPIVVHFCYMP